MSGQCKRFVIAIFVTWMLPLFGGNGNAQERAPVPDAAAQHAAKKAAGEIYGGRFALAKTADEKAALADEIIAAGLKLQAGSADQYVLLDIGRGMGWRGRCVVLYNEDGPRKTGNGRLQK